MKLLLKTISLFVIVTVVAIMSVIAYEHNMVSDTSNMLLTEFTEALTTATEDYIESNCYGPYSVNGSPCKAVTQRTCYMYKKTGKTESEEKVDKEGNIIESYTIYEYEEIERDFDICLRIPPKEAERYSECTNYHSCIGLGGSYTKHGENKIWRKE